MKSYTANKSRSQGRQFYSIVFRHPVRKDSGGKHGLRVRRGLGTTNGKVADKLVGEMNEILGNRDLWNIEMKEIAEKKYDPRIVSAFYDCLEKRTEKFIIAYSTGLGKGWDIVYGYDAKDAIGKFAEKEPDIYKLCQYPGGEIHVAKELILNDLKLI